MNVALIRNLLPVLLLATVLGGAVRLAALPPTPGGLPETCYLYSYFYHHDEAGGLRLAWSADGYTFHALNGTRSYLRPEVGENKIMRDPCLLPGPDHRLCPLGRPDRMVGAAGDSGHGSRAGRAELLGA